MNFRYKIIKEIGSGCLTDVFLVEDERETLYAMKIISEKQILQRPKMNQQQNVQNLEKQFRREVRILKNMNHQNIIKLINHNIPQESPEGKRGDSQESQKSDNSSNSSQECKPKSRKQHHMILEYVENGDLFDYIINLNEPLYENISRYYFHQLINVLEYLHNDQKIIHRDLKLENILIDKHFNIKLCDFSLSKTIQEGGNVGVYYTQVGTIRYMAPEIIEGKPYKGNTTDIFSLGVILFLMVLGVMPFYQKACKDDPLYSIIFKNDDKQYWETLNKTYSNVKGFQDRFNNISDEFKKFIWGFFQYHYFDRITIEKIKQNKWFQGIMLSKGDVQKEMQRRKILIDERKKFGNSQGRKRFE